MLANFEIPESSKDLYFKLNNAFQLTDYPCSDTRRFAGIYVIYMKEVCYYVGQSLNLPSRISTHITGKYAQADEIHFYMPSEYAFSDFYERNRDSQKAILENNEGHCLNLFKPIENILVDRDEALEDKYLFTHFHQPTDEPDWNTVPELCLTMGDGSITINDLDDPFYHIHGQVIDPYIDESIAIYEHCKKVKA